MTGDQMSQDEMDEPHPYQGPMPWVSIPDFEKNPYPLGDLNFKPQNIRSIDESGAAQLINEYGWIWLWRNGMPSKLTIDVYKYYLGEHSTPAQNFDFQAYWMQLETEWLRSNPNAAGVLAFCYLANNYGYTGDWFTGHIRDLQPSPTLEWFRHAFAPAATFINLTDERYTKHLQPHPAGSTFLFNLVSINQLNKTVSGTVRIQLIGQKGEVLTRQELKVQLDSFVRKEIPVSLILPAVPGGYVLVAEFTPENGSAVISRRFLKVGEASTYNYYTLKP
jgi:hypothetical protein